MTKSAVILNKEPHLNQSLEESEHLEVLRVIKFLDYEVIQVVKELRPEVVVFSPWVPGTQRIDPLDLLFELSLMEPTPQVILLAGNYEKTESFIMDAVSHGVYDIVFNSDKDSVLEENVKQIYARLERPRTRSQVFAELGITQRRQAPTIHREEIEKRETNVQEIQALAPMPKEHADVYPEVEQEQIEPVRVPKPVKPHIVGVISPASAGATFMASNVAAAMAFEGYKTALIDWCSKRTLHYWLGRDDKNRSFQHLFEHEELQDEETRINYLDAFTSMRDEMFYGDEDWFNTLELLSYDIVVLDFSSGDAWRKELLLRALDRCDEVLFVSDMDYAKNLQSRHLLEEISHTSGQLRMVLNKWDEEYQPCDIENLVPLPNPLCVPFCFDIYRAIVQAKPLVAIRPDLRKHFVLEHFERRVQA